LDFDIKFWGVRGTRPVSNKEFVHYGGNTPCVEINIGDNSIIFDAGTGIVDLGKQINSDVSQEINIFISHTHWDHIQGLPLFKPIYNEKNKIKIFGIGNNGLKLNEILEKQMSCEYFPIQWENLRPDIEIIELNSNSEVKIDDIEITAIEATHTSKCLNYKVSYKNKTCAYITDNEWVKGDIDKLINFIKNIDVLIVDTFFEDEEYYSKKDNLGKIGWGHGTWQQAVDLGIKSGAKKIVFCHHNEDKNDNKLDEIAKEAMKISNNICLAKEGMVITL